VTLADRYAGISSGTGCRVFVRTIPGRFVNRTRPTRKLRADRAGIREVTRPLLLNRDAPRSRSGFAFRVKERRTERRLVRVCEGKGTCRDQGEAWWRREAVSGREDVDEMAGFAKVGSRPCGS